MSERKLVFRIRDDRSDEEKLAAQTRESLVTACWPASSEVWANPVFGPPPEVIEAERRRALAIEREKREKKKNDRERRKQKRQKRRPSRKGPRGGRRR